MVHGLMNLVYSASIKQFLSDPNPPFDKDMFLTQLSAMILSYVEYDDSKMRLPGEDGTPA